MDICLYADVYGFSAMVKSDLVGTADKLAKLATAIDDIVKKKQSEVASSKLGKFHLSQFSDNIMLLFKSKNSLLPDQFCQIFELFISTCAEIHYISIDISLPMRGSISVGDILLANQQFVGLPIIEAVEVEKKIRLPLIFVPESVCSEIDKALNICHIQSMLSDCIVDIPFGEGILSAAPLISHRTDQLKVTSEEHYRRLRKDIKTSKAAQDWRDVLIIIKEIEGRSNG